MGIVLSSALSLLFVGNSQVSDGPLTYVGQAAMTTDYSKPSAEKLGTNSSGSPVAVFIRSRLKSNELWGSLKAGYFCGPMDDLRWARGPIQIDIERLRESLLQALADQEVVVIAEATAIDSIPRILITATISTAEAHLCSALQSFGNSDQVKGKVSLAVDWQVSDLSSGVLLLAKHSEGRVENPKFNKVGPDVLFEEALLMSLRQALLDGEMLALTKSYRSTNQGK